MTNVDEVIAWRIAKGNLSATEDGLILGRDGQSIGRVGQSGYVQVQIKHKNRQYAAFGHRIVWIFFNGKIEDKIQINHINGKKADNRLINLELVTATENMRHAADNGLTRYTIGTQSRAAKLSKEDIVAIRETLAEGMVQQKVIAAQYGVDPAVISNIKNGKSYYND